MTETATATAIQVYATATFSDGRAIEETKEYEFKSWARDYRDRWLARVHELKATGDVTIWFGGH